jgi:hypothetical protein
MSLAAQWIGGQRGTSVHGGSICQTVLHKGQEGTRRKIENQGFVLLRVLRGSKVFWMALSTEPLLRNEGEHVLGRRADVGLNFRIQDNKYMFAGAHS